jgi:protein-S-isoprenylcysteine O-methyltransferase Ste14
VAPPYKQSGANIAFWTLVRIHSEEHALLAGLGEEYRRYAATRRGLFPGIW